MNRRELLKAALGVPAITSIERLEAKPGDVFVMTIDKESNLCEAEIEKLRNMWRTTFKRAGLKPPPCMVFQGDFELKVIKGANP